VDRNRSAFSVLRVALAAALVGLLGVLTFHAAQRGVADLYGRHLRAQLTEWEKDRKLVPLAQWRGALDSGQAEHRLNPRSPDALESLGRLYDWAAFGKRPRLPVVIAYRQEALIYFRSAARERPVSGYTWANIAQSKLALGAFDDEFTKALELAAFLAPWEPEVQFSITDAGLAAWMSLDETHRRLVLDAAGRGLRRYSKDILRIAHERGRARLICGMPEARDAAAAQACK
jgi:hypothetical protein